MEDYNELLLDKVSKKSKKSTTSIQFSDTTWNVQREAIVKQLVCSLK